MTAIPEAGSHEPGFAQLQRLPAALRGLAFEALFYKQLQTVTARIHQTDNLDQIMLEASTDICQLFNADRLTLYAVNKERTAIVAKIKTGLSSSQEIRLPIAPHSIAGYTAMSRQLLNLADVYDQSALWHIHPELSFLKEVDASSGYRTRQMLVAPIVEADTLHGVLQIINNRNNEMFDHPEVEGMAQLCRTLATAIRQRVEAAEAQARRKASKYDALVQQSLLSAAELDQCWQQARSDAQQLEQLMMRQHSLSCAQIGHALSRYFQVPYAPFKATRQRQESLHGRLKREFLIQQGWIPLEDSAQGLLVMCTDPEAVKSARILPQVFPRLSRFSYWVTTQHEFQETLAQLFGVAAGGLSIDEMLADMGGAAVEDASSEDALESAAADNELVKFVNKVIIDAHQQNASDIHIEPMPGNLKTGIRFRIDGTLLPYIEVPANFRQAMVTRLKIMSELDISERRRPQDGKIKFRKYGPLDIELRVATIPSAGRVEDVVLRILSAGAPIPLSQLGLTPQNRAQVEKTVAKPHGLFYVCGPTGSGKTTTLHSILSHLNRPESKIWTVEDPVEITQKGLRQVQINKKAGIDFAMVMRAFLRADPDIIMVGESRDQETMAMGVEASLTGHLVFSTLHTNSAPESITRLLDMGMDPFNFADALLGVLAQRLTKKLCTCKAPYVPDEAALQAFVAEYAQELSHAKAWRLDRQGETDRLLNHWREAHAQGGELRWYRAVGCEACKQTGYRGRIGLHELLVVDEAIKQLVQQRARVADIFAAAVQAGMHTLKMDGMEKVLLGLTDMAMVRAVCIR
ncbi:MAG: hypothetical protein RL342_939 [Pseudomonadota bacterium]|nr:GAF domain-containing protein [Betaproteobacteria bacterium]